MKEKPKMKFVIVSGRQNWGGTIALHALCKYISEEGFDARIFFPFNLPDSPDLSKTKSLFKRIKRKFKYLRYVYLFVKDFVKEIIARVISKFNLCGKCLDWAFRGYIDVSVKGCKRKYLPFVDNDTVVVYPEVIYGNFLQAKNVVRWLLYFNRLYFDEKSYSKSDLFFSYGKVINDSNLNPSCRLCMVSHFNWDLYKRTNFGERSGTCYIIRKGRKRPDLPEKFDGIIIDNLTEREKVKQFNQCLYCVSYDMYTAYSGIAAMLGCISVVVPEPGKNKQDYYGDDTRYGVAFGFDDAEIDFAKSTVKDLEEEYRMTEFRNRENVKFFLKECAEYFKI